MVWILGPRQIGETTLPREIARTWQRRPDLFPKLRVLTDRDRRPARFLLLGSASPSLLNQSSESLAGRIAYVAVRAPAGRRRRDPHPGGIGPLAGPSASQAIDATLSAVKVSFFETGRYCPPTPLPSEWPVPSGAYDPDAGARAFRDMIERLRYVEALGFDWISVSEHHYSPRILTPSPMVSAAFIAAHVPHIAIALLGPIVPHSNPIRVAEELAMLDTMSEGRLVVGLLRGTTNESLTYDLNPDEARERTDEGMELVLKAWTEPQPFGWQGRHFQYRTVSIWPRPLQAPHPPTFALGTSKESCEFAARHHLGCGVSYGSFEAVARATRYYREQCARYGWEPSPEQIVYRANMIVAETDAEAEARLRALPNQAPFSMRPGVRDAMATLDSRNIAGQARAPVISGALPTTFLGSPDTVVEQVRRCREVVGAGVLDLSLHPPGSGDLDALKRALELFGTKVLPHIRDI